MVKKSNIKGERSVMEKVVIFDMDGVLIDSEPFYYWKLEKFLKLKGFNYSKECLDSLVGESSKKTFAILKGENAEFFDSELEYKTEYHAYSKRIKNDYQKLKNPNGKELVESLVKLGFRLGLASSSPAANIDQVLRELSIHEYFDVIISGDNFKESKPNPEIYMYVAEQMGVTSSSCFVIEDSYYGITAAKRAGMKVIAMKDDRYGFDQSEADYLISDLLESLNIIKENLPRYFTSNSEDL